MSTKQTRHEEFIAGLRQKAELAKGQLGAQAQQATLRPIDYAELSPEEQWAIDKRLGILDWDGTWNT
jgi:hypothetical protein